MEEPEILELPVGQIATQIRNSILSVFGLRKKRVKDQEPDDERRCGPHFELIPWRRVV